LSPDIVASEATGGFEIVVSAALAGAGLPAAVVNPALVRAFARALGKRAKTDPIDAAVIAHFAEATGLTARPVADQAMQLLADLIARRRQTVEMIGGERQREQRTTAPRLKKNIARLLKALEKELASLEFPDSERTRSISASMAAGSTNRCSMSGRPRRHRTVRLPKPAANDHYCKPAAVSQIFCLGQ
jgi:transposase